MKYVILEDIMLSKQKMEILKILETLIQASANDIKVLYEKDGNTIGSVHNQLMRLIEDGLVKRVGNAYSLTEKSKNILLFNNTNKTTIPIFLTFSEERIKEFFKFASSGEFLDNLSELLCPHILGLNTVKLSSLLTILSLDDLGNFKNRLNILLIGEAGTGKSQIIKWCYEKLWGVFSDTNTKKAGFRGGAMGYQYKEGLLQKANNSIIFIDELDKFDPQDLDVLLSAFSYGKVFINLDKVNKETNTFVRCIATCNNEKRLKQELIDRFDLVLNVKNLTEEEREKIIYKKANEWNRSSAIIDSSFIIDYIKYASKFPTKIQEDREELSTLIIEEFSCGQLKNKSIRKIESVFRIALAIGRLKLKQTVGVDEVKQALNLIKESKY